MVGALPWGAHEPARVARVKRGRRLVLQPLQFGADALLQGLEPGLGARAPLQNLADRELEVFRLIGEGVKTAEIAERLHLSIKTVETYRDRIRQKLDLSDGTKLAHYATQWVLENG